MKAKVPIHIPLGTRLMRLERETTDNLGRWKVWLATKDFKYGTFLRLYDDGCVERVTVREGEGDEIILVKPEDK